MKVTFKKYFQWSSHKNKWLHSDSSNFFKHHAIFVFSIIPWCSSVFCSVLTCSIPWRLYLQIDGKFKETKDKEQWIFCKPKEPPNYEDLVEAMIQTWGDGRSFLDSLVATFHTLGDGRSSYEGLVAIFQNIWGGGRSSLEAMEAIFHT